MSEWWEPPVPGGTGPSRWWYALAGGIALATVIATALVGYGRANDAIDRVIDYPVLEETTTPVTIAEIGEYAVYRQWLQPAPAGTSFVDPMMRVKGSHGEVPVRTSNIAYGIGETKARAIGTFEVTEPGDFLITTSKTDARLTFGKTVPGSPLYGMTRPMLSSLAVVLGCAVAAFVIARLRRGRYDPELL